MKSLQESLLDDEDILMDETGDSAIKQEIIKFLNNTYDFKSHFASYIIYKENNKFFVDIVGKYCLMNENAITFKNDLFEWGKVCVTIFGVYTCRNIKSLEGCPPKINGAFICNNCQYLTTLEGGPEFVSDTYDCTGCSNLKSLEGAPKEVGGSFLCSYCGNIKSLKGSPKKIGETFDCHACKSLTSLKGAPKEVNGNFNCYDCKFPFSEEEVKHYTKVNFNINC